jgi:hypothetical protein
MGSRSNSSNTTSNDVKNYNLQGIEAGAVVNGSGNTVTVTDQGAIKEAFSFGESALEFGGDVVESNEKVTKYALDSNTDVANNALNEGFGFAESAIESTNKLASNSFDFAENLVTQNSTNNANSISAIKELAKTVTTGGASDIADQSTRMVYAVVGVLGVGFLVMIFIGARK